MLGWIARGLRQGRITTRYPRSPEPAPAGYRGRVEVIDPEGAEPELADLCPTGAITVDGRADTVTLDRGRCILCGECGRVAADRFRFVAEYETADALASALIVRRSADAARPRADRARRCASWRRRAGRSIHVRHIDCGSDGSEEWEIQALWNPYYDIQRLGFFLTPAPRHADVLLATGGVTAAMREPLQRTWEVMPAPKALVAVGTDACSGGLAGRPMSWSPGESTGCCRSMSMCRDRRRRRSRSCTACCWPSACSTAGRWRHDGGVRGRDGRAGASRRCSRCSPAVSANARRALLGARLRAAGDRRARRRARRRPTGARARRLDRVRPQRRCAPTDSRGSSWRSPGSPAARSRWPIPVAAGTRAHLPGLAAAAPSRS